MSEQRKEYVSALVDNELDTDTESVLDDVLKTASLKNTLARYHLISDSLKQNIPESVDVNLAEKIAAKIDGEPTVLAPQARSTNNVFLKPVAGFAIAASVAAMAILGIQQNQEGTMNQRQELLSFTPQANVNTITPQNVVNSTPSEAQLRLVKANTRARLNSYLVNYNEYRTNSGVQGMLPYARTVTFENNK